jgi:hypothetical protein
LLEARAHGGLAAWRAGREESYEVPVPAAKVSGATSVEIHLYDRPGNSPARRLVRP